MSNPDNVEVFTKLCQAIHDRLPNLGYVHMVESRGDPAKLANWATAAGDAPDAETLNPFRKIFEGSATAFLSAGGYTADLAREVVQAHGGAVVFGRIFISSKFNDHVFSCSPAIIWRHRIGLARCITRCVTLRVYRSVPSLVLHSRNTTNLRAKYHRPRSALSYQKQSRACSIRPVSVPLQLIHWVRRADPKVHILHH